MAKQTIVSFVDDLDGSPAEGPVEFGIDGRQYEIDLSAGNAGKLRDALAEFVAAARRTGGRRTASAAATASTRPDREQVQAKREWARANGFDVPERGRLRADIEEAYANRGRNGATVTEIRSTPTHVRLTPVPASVVEEEPAKPLDEKGKAEAVAASKPPKKASKAKSDTALKAAADKAEAKAATAVAAKAGKLPGVKVKTLTGAQARAIEDFKLSTFEVGSTFVVFKGATPAEVLAEIKAAIKVYSGERNGGSYRALTSVVRKLQKADPTMVAVVEVDASAA